MGADGTLPLAPAPAVPDALEDACAEAEAVASEDSYAAQLETVRRLRASGASAEAVRAAAARLKELKRGAYEKLPRGTVGRKKKRRAALDAGVTVLDVQSSIAKRDAPAVAMYPPIDLPPTDEDGFVLSFDVPSKTEPQISVGETQDSSSEDVKFFKRYGFVVYMNVLSAKECAATRDEIFKELERLYENFNRNDLKTYGQLPIETYGLAPDPAVFTPRCVANRQNENVARCLSRVLGIKDPHTDLLVSHDRWCVYRPTKNLPGVGDRPDWKTRANLHLDLNPWTYLSRAEELQADDGETTETATKTADRDNNASVAETLSFDTLRDFSRETNCVEERTGPHCQGVVMLAENRVEDGGLKVVPGFHDAFERWVKNGLGDDPQRFADAHDDWRFSRLVVRAGGAGSFKFGDDDFEIQKRAFRVAAREGSYVVWDQRLVHGTAPNDSSKARIAQFIKGFRKSKVGAGRLKRRSERVRLEIRKAGAETEAAVSELGRKLFGLE